MDLSDITLCLTIGNRPKELQESLPSLLHYCPFEHIIAINDFGDAASSEVLLQICPHATLLRPARQLGHHGAVDMLYQRVQTPYIFHTEDDWFFDQAPNLQAARQLLQEQPQVSSVCFRSLSDFAPEHRYPELAQAEQHAQAAYFRLDTLHAEWHGYTFNPHLARLQTWQDSAGFSRFKKERHVSRHMRALGQFIAYQDPGSCHHIGFDSVANPVSPWTLRRKRLKQLVKNLFA